MAPTRSISSRARRPSRAGSSPPARGAAAISSRADRIAEEVTAWPGVEAGHGSRGEFGFKLGRHEIGHLHGDRAAHFMFGKDLGLRLKAEGRVVDHPVFPGKPGPGARRIEDDEDVRDVIDLMRLNYDRLRARGRGTRAADDGAPSEADSLQDGQSAG